MADEKLESDFNKAILIGLECSGNNAGVAFLACASLIRTLTIQKTSIQVTPFGCADTA